MSSSIRAFLVPLLFAGSIAFGWHMLTESLGQGVEAILAGGYGIFLGAVVVGMGLMIPAGGLIASLCVAHLLRGPAPEGSADAPRPPRIHVASQLAYALSIAAATSIMWRIAPPQPGEYARFGTAFFVLAGLLALAFSVCGALFSARILLRRPLF